MDVEVLELIAGALTSAEREFSYAAGQNIVQPGEYLTDRKRAEVVIRDLTDAGFVVTKKS